MSNRSIPEVAGARIDPAQIPADSVIDAIVTGLEGDQVAGMIGAALRAHELRAAAGRPGATPEEGEQASRTYAQLWAAQARLLAAGAGRVYQEEAQGRVIPFPATGWQPGKGA